MTSFEWRGMRVAVDRVHSGIAGEVVWLKRADGQGPRGLGVIREGRMILSKHAPTGPGVGDDLLMTYREYQATRTAPQDG